MGLSRVLYRLAFGWVAVTSDRTEECPAVLKELTNCIADLESAKHRRRKKTCSEEGQSSLLASYLSQACIN